MGELQRSSLKTTAVFGNFAWRSYPSQIPIRSTSSSETSSLRRS
jgi:hypothetical protein